MKRFIDLSLYLVTNRQGLELDEFFHIICLAIEGGVKIVQLREKEASAGEMIAIGKRLLSYLKPRGIPLMINDRVDVAHAVGADGVHLGQSDLRVADARAILGRNAIIGLSVESLEQALEANEEDVDYLAASPLFCTKTKTDCAEPWGLNGLQQLCDVSRYPVIAIGGINETNAKQIIECGAAGVAVVSAIFNAPCPTAAALRMIDSMKTHPVYKVLTIAGFDGSGGAGIQADLKTFSALGCYGTTALTALPVQNTMGVRSIYDIDTACVEEQIRAILEDMPMNAVKIGMLHRQDIIESVANILSCYNAVNVVLDPVMVAKSGDKLLMPEAIASMKERLLPIVTVLTPNLLEASELLEREVQNKAQMEKAALDLVQMGPQAVVVKGGHLNGDCDDCLCLKNPNLEIHWFSSPRIQTKNTHGTGCTFSAAIAAFLARGCTILDAITQAKEYLTRAVDAGKSLNIGRGHGPVHHFYDLWNISDSHR